MIGEGSRRQTRLRFSLLCGVGLLVSVATPTRAALLNEPPRVYPTKLADPGDPSWALLRRYLHADIERPTTLRSYAVGPWGRWQHTPWVRLGWAPGVDDTDEASAVATPLAADGLDPVAGGWLLPGGLGDDASLELDPGPSPIWFDAFASRSLQPAFATTGHTFRSNGFDALWQPKAKPIPWSLQCRRRPVTVVRFGGEQETFELVGCDGSVAPFALDRLSILARPPLVDRPGDLLPDEPEPDAWSRGEWVPSVHLVSSRLLWALQKVADAFPRRMVYLYSGYRPPTSKPTPSGTHNSFHALGRALDIHVHGVDDADLFRYCRTLPDVGCGYYPNSKFVHVDVRFPATGKAYWIDASSPGEPSRYVDSWPGVVESGALVWDQRAAQKQRAMDARSPGDMRDYSLSR